MYTTDLSRGPPWEEAPWLNAIGEILEDKVRKRTAGRDGLPAEDCWVGRLVYFCGLALVRMTVTWHSTGGKLRGPSHRMTSPGAAAVTGVSE